MRILHTSDWHLGRQFHTVALDEDHDFILAQIEQIIGRYEPDLLIIAGDIFDRAVPPQSALTRFGNFINKEISFSGAFALSAWASVPSLLLLPLGAIQILLAANGQVGFSELNPLSLNQLFFQYEMSHPMAAVLDSLSFTSVLGIVLLVIGFEVWTKVSRATALMVVLPPYVLFYGAWLAYAMSQTA